MIRRPVLAKPLALAAAVAAVVMTSTGVALALATPVDRIPIGLRREELAAYLVLQASLVTVGALLSLRRPRNPIGWLLAVTSLVSAGEFLFAGYAVFGLFRGLPGAQLAAWLYSWTGLGMGVAMGWLASIFPDGRFRSRWARASAVCISLGAIPLAMAAALRPGPLAEVPSVRNPFGWDAGVPVINAAMFLGAFLAVAALVLLFKHVTDRSREGTAVERQQIKWVVWCIGIIMVTTLAALPWIVGVPDPAGADATARYFARVAVALAMTTFPIGIALAILRYRLYDIDVLINRTLVYGSLTAVIGSTYVASVVLFQSVLRPLTGGSELAVAGSTLATLALVQPLRRWIQDAVDRRFYRSRYDAARTLDAFVERLQAEVGLDAVRGQLLEVVATTVRPAHAGLWLREDER